MLRPFYFYIYIILSLDLMLSTSSALRSFSPLPELQLTIYLPGDIAATCNSFAPRLNFSKTRPRPP